MIGHFDLVNTRFLTLERRLSRTETQFHAFNIESSGVFKSLTGSDRLDGYFLKTQAAQENATRNLYAGVKELQRRTQRAQ